MSLLILTLAACAGIPGIVSGTRGVSQSGSLNSTATTEDLDQVEVDALASTLVMDFDSEDLNAQAIEEDTTFINLDGKEINVQGKGAEAQGSTVTISGGGSYLISGRLDDGQVIVDSQDEETVHLILSGVEITSMTSAPIYIQNAEKTVITLDEGTENIIADGDAYQLDEEGEPDGAIFSKDDLTINGSGGLSVFGNHNHGIVSKDDLKIVSGAITIQAINDGLKGRDSVSILDGEIEITAGGDGLQSTNEEETGKGSVEVEGGNLQITAGEDGIQAATTLAISGGVLEISSGEVSQNGPDRFGSFDRNADFGDTGYDSGVSAKGLKAGTLVVISGGTLEIDSADDAIHSNDTIQISEGIFYLASGDDGLHADSLLNISGGELELRESYEGIESAEIIIRGGSLHLTSSDDGINASTGSGGDGVPGRGGFGGGDSSLTISGGYIYVDAGGDGIDANGSVSMSGGTVLVNGPTNAGNGALDYLSEFHISGGILVAVGSIGMAQAPSQSSSQYSILYTFDTSQNPGKAFQLTSQSGEVLLTFSPSKQYQSVVISSPDLVPGATYQLLTGSPINGSIVDGFSISGDSSGGSLVESITLSNVVTTAGTAEGGFFMGSPGGGGRPRGRGN